MRRRACAHALVGLPAPRHRGHRGPRRRVDDRARQGRPRRRGAHHRRADDRRRDRLRPSDTGRRFGARAADRGRPAVVAAGRHGGAHGVGQPCVHQAGRAARSAARTGGGRGGVETRHRPRPRLAHGMGRGHAGRHPPGAVRPHDARDRTDAPRWTAAARRPHRHQLGRMVARVPGRPTDRADPVHGRAADHRFRARRRPGGAHPQRRRPDVLAAARPPGGRARTTGAVVGQRPVREGVPGARPLDAPGTRHGAATSGV